ncbi:amino acid permease [Endozoicomonas euniceicola]|uniref:Amino acid permease n=1 Tax=Endozoicomonas euniceicola TaxID=1234143 RepID=A0ABY6GVD6_9GAMM|nr:amino acid permease [Endozoicomonas euniceicola]UYM16547.1 amino acid permease [Endozoicomonas euniceicola]
MTANTYTLTAGREAGPGAAFDQLDWGWIVMSIGMAIGAGIVFLPVQVGMMGVWVFLLSSLIGYPAMYLFQKLFINTLVESNSCKDYSSIITEYLGKNWGIALGLLYFIMQVIWVFVYSLAITNDSASYLHTFGITDSLLSENPLYSLGLISTMVFIASYSEKFLFRISGFMAVSVLLIVFVLGAFMVPHWDVANISAVPPSGELFKNAIITLPFTLTSILFIQSLSPMTIAFRKQCRNPEEARYRSQRAMKMAFGILFCVVFFYAISFTLTITQSQATDAFNQNISSLAIIAQHMDGSATTVLGILINIFAVATSFLAIFLAFREACTGIVMNVLHRRYTDDQINHGLIRKCITVFIILLSWMAVVTNIPILHFTSFCSPVFGLIGCLIPAYLVHKVDKLAKYRGWTTNIIIVVGLLLMISPFLNFLG